jgi:hypothetical protein
MNAVARLIPVASVIFLVGTMTCTAGCSDETAVDPTSEDDLSAANRASLIAKVKAAYEDSVHNQRAEVLPGAANVDPSKLRWEAASAWRQFQDNFEAYGFGEPSVQVAKVDRFTVYIVDGIVSDTGDEVGFYDSRGKKLASAYTGQGERPNENGVDWWE